MVTVSATAVLWSAGVFARRYRAQLTIGICHDVVPRAASRVNGRGEAELHAAGVELLDPGRVDINSELINDHFAVAVGGCLVTMKRVRDV